MPCNRLCPSSIVSGWHDRSAFPELSDDTPLLTKPFTFEELRTAVERALVEGRAV
jgi:hypothetical protein